MLATFVMETAHFVAYTFFLLAGGACLGMVATWLFYESRPKEPAPPNYPPPLTPSPEETALLLSAIRPAAEPPPPPKRRPRARKKS